MLIGFFSEKNYVHINENLKDAIYVYGRILFQDGCKIISSYKGNGYENKTSNNIFALGPSFIDFNIHRVSGW